MDTIKAPAPSHRHRRGFFALLGALLLILVACQPAERGPAIWRLADQDSEIWLFGTVHILPPDLKWRTARIDNAFALSDTVVFETDTRGEGRGQLVTLFRRHGYDRRGPPLSQKLPPAERDRLARIAKKLGVTQANLDELEQMRPWYAALQLSFLFVQSTGQDTGAGVDAVLAAEAVRQGKQLTFLETAEEQVGFLADLAPEVELEFLIVSLRQIEEEEGSLADIDQAWARGDTRKLARLLNGLVEEAGPEVYRALITDRNRRWTTQIEQMLEGRGKIFVAVGTAHLVGRDSVIAQLRARGHRVEGP
jgi:uncharacterized protein YbaP (TraB family)